MLLGQKNGILEVFMVTENNIAWHTSTLLRRQLTNAFYNTVEDPV